MPSNKSTRISEQNNSPLPPGIEHPASLEDLQKAAATCRACSLWENATQTVFGSGSGDAKVMLIGEQPGDQEDLQGQPFIGPAGQLLRKALLEADLQLERIYLTNAVKHFKWELRGRRRLHKTPGVREIKACHPWVEAEIQTLRPQVIGCLGATAAKAIIDKNFKITVDRGRFIDNPVAPFVFATLHPSYLLRLPDEEARKQQYRSFIEDLRLIHKALENT
jgi:DNA polymerase